MVVVKSSIKKLIASEQRIKKAIKSITKPSIFRTCFSAKVFLAIFKGSISLGWIRVFISLKASLATTITRIIFIPPPVDPAHPPKNISMTKR